MRPHACLACWRVLIMNGLARCGGVVRVQVEEVVNPAPADVVRSSKLEADGCSGLTVLLIYKTVSRQPRCRHTPWLGMCGCHRVWDCARLLTLGRRAQAAMPAGR